MKDILLDSSLDIKDLGVIPDQEGFRPTFDPASELSEADWENLNSYLIKLRRTVQRKNGRESILDNAVKASLELQLLTGQKANLTKITDLKLLEWAIFHMKEGPVGYAIERIRGGTDDLIVNLLLLNPLLRMDLDIQVHTTAFETHFSGITRGDEFYSSECFNARVILGEDALINLRSIDDQPFFDPFLVRNSLLNRWNPRLQLFGPATAPNSQTDNILSQLFGSWTKALVCAKALVPTLPRDFELDDERWAVLKQWLGVCRNNGNWRSFLELAANMYLLSADKIEITEEGLKVVHQIESFQSKNDLPLTRGYR